MLRLIIHIDAHKVHFTQQFQPVDNLLHRSYADYMLNIRLSTAMFRTKFFSEMKLLSQTIYKQN